MGKPNFSGCQVGPYLLNPILGVGSGGTVYGAIDMTSKHHTPFAVKCMPIFKRTREEGIQIIREILYQDALTTRRAPNVLPLHDILQEGPYIFLVLNLCETNMFRAILNNVYLGNGELIRKAFIEVLDGVRACHARGVYHRDLKPGNIMCRANGTGIQIGDFGMATHHPVSWESEVGTRPYMSPECWMINDGEVYNSASADVWSLGVILFNMVTSRYPWLTAVQSDKNFKAYIDDPNYLYYVSPVSRKLNAMLKSILHPTPKKRPSIPEIQKMVIEIDTFYKERS